MRLNSLKPADGSKKNARRLGRGHTRGKTCGRGHKGQKSRSGGKVAASFEGGQMPIQRRLPKTGFVAHASLTHEEIPLYKLESVIKRLDDKSIVVDMEFLQRHAVIKASTKTVKIILSGSLSKPVTIEGLKVTRGAVSHIEKLGGKVQAPEESVSV